MVVTSPPYFGLRRYAGGTDADFGRERTIQEYVNRTVIALREIRRVLRPDGVIFWNVGDTYHGSGRGMGATDDTKFHRNCDGNPFRGQGKTKNLCLIPGRVAIAASDDGWIVRSIIVWNKPNSVPESVQDRCSSSYEVILMLVKQRNYFWNPEGAREPAVTAPHAVGAGPKGDAFIADGTHGERSEYWDWDMRLSNKTGASKTEKRLTPIGNRKNQRVLKGTLGGNKVEHKWMRNLRNVWTINTRPHRESHIAMFPEELVQRCIRIASRPGDIVMDCFAGSGTTGLVAQQMGCSAILLDISEEYVNLMKQRVEGNR
jgi:DNA modification methylase